MVVPKQSAFEESRLRRVEENKKRMEALNLPTLCQNLRSKAVKISPMKKSILRTRYSKELVIVRRSRRLSNASSSSSSSPVYKEVVVQRQRVQIPMRVRKGILSNRVYVSQDIKEEAISKAEKLQADLGGCFPSFVKSVLHSHVSGNFWRMPVHFCRSQLQKQDGVITLIDEQGEEFETVYLAKRNGLSGGWVGFVLDHSLACGDALVFELIRPTAFKVYITRVGSCGESPKI